MVDLRCRPFVVRIYRKTGPGEGAGRGRVLASAFSRMAEACASPKMLVLTHKIFSSSLFC